MRSMNHPNLIKIYEVIEHTSKAGAGPTSVGAARASTPPPPPGARGAAGSRGGTQRPRALRPTARLPPAPLRLPQVVLVQEYAEAGPLAQARAAAAAAAAARARLLPARGRAVRDPPSRFLCALLRRPNPPVRPGPLCRSRARP